MTQSRSPVPVSRRLPLVESLENRQLMALTVDVRMAGGGAAPTITKVGQVLNLELWATAKGANADGSDDGLQNFGGTILSSNVSGGSVLGTLSATLLAPFNGPGSNSTQRDDDGDGDLDVGNTSSGANTSSGLFFARSATMTTTGGTIANGGQSFKIADLTFTVTNLLGGNGAYTELKFVPRNIGVLAGNNAVWREDGAGRVDGGASDNGDFLAGTSVILRRNIGLISGKVFNDKNGNGAFDGKDTRLKGVQIYIDSNSNGVLDLGERSVRSTGSGLYTFGDLKAGTYRVRVNVPPAGMRQTKPGGGYTVNLGVGGAVTGRNFGFTGLTQIVGHVFNDVNGNGVNDGGDGIWAGWRVFADVNGDGLFSSAIDRGVLTDASGNFNINTLPAGTWTIRASAPINYAITSPTGNGTHLVTVASGQTSSNLAFGIRKLS